MARRSAAAMHTHSCVATHETGSLTVAYDCHQSFIRLTDRVAHVAAHPPLTGCTQDSDACARQPVRTILRDDGPASCANAPRTDASSPSDALQPCEAALHLRFATLGSGITCRRPCIARCALYVCAQCMSCAKLGADQCDQCSMPRQHVRQGGPVERAPERARHCTVWVHKTTNDSSEHCASHSRAKGDLRASGDRR